MFLVGQSYYQNERDLSPINDILVWEELEFINYSINYNESGFDNVSVQSIRVSNILTSAINFFGYATFELCKMSVEFGYKYNDFDYYSIIELIKYIFSIYMFVLLIPVIIPIMALLYLLFVGLYYLYKKIFKK